MKAFSARSIVTALRNEVFKNAQEWMKGFFGGSSYKAIANQLKSHIKLPRLCRVK